MARLPVSTVLLARNGMKLLPKYVESMRDIDDIIVLDGGSTDGTVEFLKAQPNCRVFPQNPKYLDAEGFIIDFSGMRNEGYALAKHKWILCVDADEEASPELLKEVERIAADGKPGVYYARRVFLLDGKPIVTLPGTTSDQIRLFHLDAVRGCVKPVHEKLDVLPGAHRGTVGTEVIVHVPDAATVRRKWARYMAIEVRHNRGIGWWRWFRWIAVRNTLSSIRRLGVIVAVRLLPKRGPRYPLALEWEQVRYSFLVAWKSCPGWNR